ncbi:hypothetical protein N309_12572, partial [Tinamus guttatus]
GSAGVDLATTIEVLITDTSVVLIPTGVHGPLGRGMAALLIGRFSTTRQGLFVLPAVINADFKGEIKIMVWTPIPPCTVPAGSRIAQLVYFLPQTPNAANINHGTGSFGSTGHEIFWTQQITMNRPQISCTLQAGLIKFNVQGILDSGADVTVIA